MRLEGKGGGTSRVTDDTTRAGKKGDWFPWNAWVDEDGERGYNGER